MNLLPCSINTLKEGLYDLSGVEVGQHFYWQLGGFQVHAQVLITSWVVIAILLGSVSIAVRNPQTDYFLLKIFDFFSSCGSYNEFPFLDFYPCRGERKICIQHFMSE